MSITWDIEEVLRERSRLAAERREHLKALLEKANQVWHWRRANEDENGEADPSRRRVLKPRLYGVDIYELFIWDGCEPLHLYGETEEDVLKLAIQCATVDGVLQEVYDGKHDLPDMEGHHKEERFRRLERELFSLQGVVNELIDINKRQDELIHRMEKKVKDNESGIRAAAMRER